MRKKVRRIRRQGQTTAVIEAKLEELPADQAAVDAKVALVQSLIPLGLLHVAEALQQEGDRRNKGPLRSTRVLPYPANSREKWQARWLRYPA
jgi:hypothetical protein